jgi:outer membrane protein assembly factor BamB
MTKVTEHLFSKSPGANFPSWLSVVLSVGCACLISGSAIAQTDSDRQVQIHSADATTELRFAQVEQALAANESSEAIAQLQKISDEAAGRLIAFPASSLNESFPFTRFLPLDAKVAWQRNEWQSKYPQALHQYRATVDARIRQQLDLPQSVTDAKILKQIINEARSSSHETESLIRLGDLYLYRGWVNAARDCYQRTSTALRAPIGLADQTALTSVPWHFILRKFPLDQGLPATFKGFFAEPPPRCLGSSAIASPPSFETVARLIWCSILDDDITRAKFERRLLAECAGGDETERQQWLTKIDGWIASASPAEVRSSETELSTFRNGPGNYGNGLQRNETIVAAWSLAPGVETKATLGEMIWSQRLPRRYGTYEQLADHLPRASESSQGLLSHYPSIYGDRVFVNELNRIVAYDLETGKGWPSPTNRVPLYEHTTLEDQIAPLGYPMVGVPRGTLSILDDKLYARVGSAITGWRNANEFATASQSAIVGLDLQSEGRMLPGFPILLAGEGWANCEFEGSPLLIGDDLFVAITQRNSVQLRRFVACFDRFTARFKWRSPLLAAALPNRAEQANVISHQLLSFSSGRLFLDTGLGAIAAVDADNGSIAWLVRYARVDSTAEAYPRSQRFRQRDMTPPLIHRELVICAPQDCREIFALDWATGDLLWATEPGIANDAIHLLGTQANTLFVSGDRLYWLDVWSGRQVARYPESGSDLPGHALPWPRGLGRGLITQDAVLWPVAGKLLSFDIELGRSESGRAFVKPPWEIDLGTRMGEGAHLASNGKWLFLATPSRLMAFLPTASGR